MHVLILGPGVLAVVVLAKVLITLVQRALSPLSRVPGPWYTRWTSVVLTYKWLCGQRAQYVQRLHEKYGTVVRLSPSEVDFFSVSAAKRIHGFKNPLPKTEMYAMFDTASGSANIFSARNADFHARHRRLLSSAMSETSLKSAEALVQRRADLAIEKIGLDMKQYGVVNVLKWFMFFTTDVIGELTFGESFKMLEIGKENQYMIDLQKLAVQDGPRKAFPGLIKLASFLPIPSFSENYAAIQRMQSYAETSLQRYQRLVAENPNDPPTSLFSKLFNAKSGETLSEEELVGDAQSYIIAGSDTTAHTLTYLTWEMCRRPEMKARLVEELAGLPEEYRDEDLKALPYLNQVIMETLRVYAAAPALLPRQVPPTGCEIDGFFIPPIVEVQTQAYSMHRNPEVYPEPERFNPSRWEHPTKDMKDAWMPFGGGARTCIGLHLAKMELRIATAKFFRTFPNAKLSTAEGFCEDDMEQIIYILMYPKNKRCLIQAS